MLAARDDIAVVLVLWQGGDAGELQALVRSLGTTGENGSRLVMVRSEVDLAPEMSAALWQLGVTDVSVVPTLPAGDLVGALLALLHHARRYATMVAATAAAQKFSGALNLRQLAALALREFERQSLGQDGGLFCFQSRTGDPGIRVIAAAGRYAGLGVMPVQALADAQAATLMQRVLARRESEFHDDAAVIHTETPDGHAAAIFLPLAQPLTGWQQSCATVLARGVAVAIDRTQLEHRLLRTQHATITTMATLAEYRDVDTGEHVARVARAATEIAQALADRGVAGVDASLVEHIGLATILHDIGKIAIAESILMKPGPLDAQERLSMQTHVTLGRDILLRAAKRSDNGELLRKAAEIAYFHHERYDGGGYPEGRSGENIPLAARIVALVDVFDALTSLRPYKPAWPVAAALELICNEAGKHFDPVVVDVFLKIEEQRKAAHFVAWSDAMSVGHADLNFDHQRLLGIINRLWIANDGGNRQVIEFVLDDLVNYTEFHFQREEQLLAAAGFPGYQRHCAIHAAICQRLEEIRWEYFQGIHDELRNEILDFLKTWLNHHILEEDMSYRDYLENAAA